MAARSKPERKAPAGTITKGEAKRNDWQTPEDVLERIRLVCPSGDIALDPATANDNPTRARSYCSPAPVERWKLQAKTGGAWVSRNGLTTDWVKEARGGLVFVNPPYGRAAGGNDWILKIGEEAARGAMIVALLGVSRTEQGYMTDMLVEANALCFIRGRVAFRNPSTGDLVSGNCYASWAIGFNVDPRRFRLALEPFAAGSKLRAAGARSACFELRAL